MGRGACIALVWLLAASAAHAQQAVETGGGTGYLLAPSHPRASAVLLPGGGGAWNGVGFLSRNQTWFANAGIATIGLPRGSSVTAAISYMRHIARPVALVAMSLGTLEAAKALVEGAKPDRLVLASGLFVPEGRRPSVTQILGSPASLPRTLVLSNRADDCPDTPTAGALAFKQWAGTRVALAILSVPSPRPHAPPCGPYAAHSYYGSDNAALAPIARFVGGR